MYDVLIIGAGPAGISASLYAKRAGASVLVLHHGKSNLKMASQIDNYYGFENGVDGNILYNSGIEQAKNIGVDVKKEEVLDIKVKQKIFTVETIKDKYNAKAVIIATGEKKLRPDIDGIKCLEGKGISYCAVCDGFLYKNKNVGVIGNGEYALKEANYLKGIAAKVTIYTDGQPQNYKNNIEINTSKIKKIHGDKNVSGIELEDGTVTPLDGIFIAVGEAGATDFAKKLGIILNKEWICVDEKMNTNIEGLYACGDATGEIFQISKAVYQGTVAGLVAVKYIKNL